MVNVSHTDDSQLNPAVAVSDSRQIVVAWESEKQDDPDDKLGVFAQRFDFTTGAAVDGEIAVNTATAHDQKAPSVAVAADGKIYLSNEDGDMVVVTAGREFEHIATNSMGELLMATPALSEGVMYVRSVSSLFAIGRPLEND